MRLPQPQSNWALFLDFDGSLIELAETPEAIHVDPRLSGLLAALAEALGGAVAVVSGRRLAELDRLLGLDHLPAAGIHGVERRRADGSVVRDPTARAPLDGFKRRLAAFARDRAGVMVEDKGAALALHYRQAPEARIECRRLVEETLGGSRSRFTILEGKRVFEIKPRGADKGRAIEAFLAEPPFAGRIPVFCGDDVTDEDGFAAVNRRHGVSIRVGDGAESAARWRVASVGELVAWLATIPDALGRGAAGASA